MKFIPWFKALNFPQQSFRPPVKANGPVIHGQNCWHLLGYHSVNFDSMFSKIILDRFNPARLEATGRNNNNPVFFAYFLERFFDSRNRRIWDIGNSLPAASIRMDDAIEIEDYCGFNNLHLPC